MSIQEHVNTVKETIAAAALAAGRDPGDITLCAATKVQTDDTIRQAIAAGITVVLNLQSTKQEIARRLLDFLSGVAYAGEGKIKKVAISTYIITPYNVDILGDLIDELENNGLYF